MKKNSKEHDIKLYNTKTTPMTSNMNIDLDSYCQLFYSASQTNNTKMYQSYILELY